MRADRRAPRELEITGFSHDGRGVAREQGKTVFVAGALLGERVIAQLYKRGRRFDEASVVEVLSPSPDRVGPGCEHFGVCAGCAMQHLRFEQQIAAKQQVLADNLSRLGQVEPLRWLEPLQGPPWGYRRRARLSVRDVPKKGRVLVGFREANGRYVADIQSCPVLDPRISQLLPHLSALAGELSVRDQIPQIEVSAGDEGIALVIRHLAPLSEADRAALAAFAEAHQVTLYGQIKGPETITCVAGPDSPMRYGLPDYSVDYEFLPSDFIQVNAAMNRMMVAAAVNALALKPEDRVLDLFCGLGNFSLPIARSGARVCGVEGAPELVARARHNAERQGLAVEFAVADLSADHRDVNWAQDHWNKLLLDPPRAGAAEVLKYLPGSRVERVVYVSCHPGSLARDAGVLVREHGFALSAAGVMDMFPHTAHVESLAIFDRMR